LPPDTAVAGLQRRPGRGSWGRPWAGDRAGGGGTEVSHPGPFLTILRGGGSSLRRRKKAAGWKKAAGCPPTPSPHRPLRNLKRSKERSVGEGGVPEVGKRPSSQPLGGLDPAPHPQTPGGWGALRLEKGPSRAVGDRGGHGRGRRQRRKGAAAGCLSEGTGISEEGSRRERGSGVGEATS